MSLKEKFDKAGLTGTTVALPKGKTKDENGDEKDYKTSKETKKLVKESQTKDAKVIKTPGAYVKGVSFANKTEKKKTKANTAADKVSKVAGGFVSSANAVALNTASKNVSLLADDIAKSRETATGVKAPIAATKGSVFVNKGYDPQNKERSERETQNLKSLSAKANDYAKTMKEKEESIDTNAKAGLGTVGNVVYDLGKAGTLLAMDSVANLLVPGAGLASMGARSFGQGMQTAEEQGKTGARALAYAAGTAAIEAGTEKISAAAKPLKAIYGVGLVDDAMKKLTSKLVGTSKGRQILAEIGRSAAGEAGEEALADVLQVPLQNLTLQNGAKFDADMLADTAYDALLGGIMGGVLGTAGNIGAMAQTRTESKGNAKADVIANAMTQAVQKNAQKNAPPVFQTAQKQTEQPETNGNGLTPYTEQEKINLSSGRKNKIISSFQDTVNFVLSAISDRNNVDRAYLGKVPDDVAQNVLKQTGIDISGYTVMMNGNDIRHIMKEHGNVLVEQARSQVAVTPNDIAKIPEILSSPDNVYLSENVDGKGRKAIVFEKQFGDKYITIQGVSDGKKALQTDTMYIKRRTRETRDTMLDVEENAAPVINAQSEPPQSSSIANNIPSSAENSNRNSDGIGSKTQNTETHIDQRTAQSVSDRNVKAFQYEHPEVRPFYQTAAEDLLADADMSTQMPAGSRKERTMQGNRHVHTTQTSAPLRYAMDMGMSRQNIMDGAEDIIKDEGAENNANAKRVELVLDKMLTEGYSTMFGKNAGQNAEYIKAKQGIPGYQEQAQGEELPIWDMTQDEQQRSREVLRDAVVGATIDSNKKADPVYIPAGELTQTEKIDPIETDRRIENAVATYKISDSESKGIQLYVAGQAYGFTKMQRGESDVDPSPYDLYFIDQIISGLYKHPVYQGRTYRNLVFGIPGEKINAYERFLHEYSAGNTVILDAFSSASKDPNGYTVSGDKVIHIVIDGLTGRDISETYSIPQQQEVVYMPGTKLIITNVTTANDGYPLIYAQEVVSNGNDLGRNNEQRFNDGTAKVDGRVGQNAERKGYDNGAVYGDGRIPDDGQKMRGVPFHQPGSVYAGGEEISKDDGLGAADRGSLNTENQGGNSVGSAKSKHNVKRKISQYRLNTLEKILSPEELGNIQDTDFSYQVLPDEQVMEQARDRITYQERGEDGELHTVYDIEPEMKYLRESSMWSAEDVVTAGMISKRLKEEAYESGDWSDYNKWEKSCQEHATQLGQALRSFYLYQSDADAAVSNAANILDKTDLPLDEKNAITSEICSRVDAIMKMQDEQSLIDAIESIARRRGTTKRGMAGILFGKDKGLSKKIRKYLNAMDFETLQSKALQSAQDMAADYTKRSVGERVKTIQVMNQLGNLITFERNLVGNFAFGLQDATSNNIAASLDMILAKFTGTRSQEFNTYFANKGQREAAAKAMQNAIVDIALDIDDISENRYGITSGRTFKMNGKGIKGPMTRFLSTMEKYLSYSLTASDEFFKGGARAGTEQGLRSLYEAGKLNIQSGQTSIDGMNNPEVDKFIREKADEKARYVTFQNDSNLTDLTQGAHDALNQLVGIGRKQGRNGKKTHAFGVGDLLMPYTKVPANLASRAVEYSPIGMAIGVKDFVETIISAKKGNLDINQQRKAVQNASKGINGTVLWVAFAVAALSGAIRNADDQDDEDVAALNAAEGLSGTQVNLDAIARIMSGGSAEWQKGDTLVGISFLEPLNAAMAAGTMLAEDYRDGANLKDYILDSGNKVFESILETPVMQTINTLYTDMSYGNGIIESVVDASLSSVASSVVPALLRQAAKAGDNNYRDVYSEDTMQGQLRDKLKQNVPGLRQTLPKKLDNFGREKTYTDNNLTNFVNAFIAPGSINTYKQSSVSKTLEKLGDTTLYPQRNAPKSVTVDHEEINLTYNQRQKFQKVRGGTSFSTMSAMTKTSVYKNASKEDRIALLSMCNEYASAIAQDEVISKYELSKRYTNAKESGNPAEFLANVYIYGTDNSGNIDEKVRTAVEQYGMSASQFTDIRSDLNNIKADKDENGESIDGTRKKKVIEYLNSLNLTEEQYNYVYHLEYKK